MLVGYTNAYMVEDFDSRKSTSCHLIIFARCVVALLTTMQKYVALFSTKAKHIATMKECKEFLWMKAIMKKFGFIP